MKDRYELPQWLIEAKLKRSEEFWNDQVAYKKDLDRFHSPGCPRYDKAKDFVFKDIK